jgi:hypothetical protein
MSRDTVRHSLFRLMRCDGLHGRNPHRFAAGSNRLVAWTALMRPLKERRHFKVEACGCFEIVAHDLHCNDDCRSFGKW